MRYDRTIYNYNRHYAYVVVVVVVVIRKSSEWASFFAMVN